MNKKVVQIGDPIVRAKSKDLKLLEIKSKRVKKIIQDLVDSMRHNNLVGMAAPQIGFNLNIFVVEVRPTKFRPDLKAEPLRVFINPKLLNLSEKKKDMLEGCGSVDYGNLHGPVKRHTSVEVKAYDEHGQLFRMKANNLLGHILQHEYDHLKGILCIDKFSSTRKIYHKENKGKQKRLQK